MTEGHSRDPAHRLHPSHHVAAQLRGRSQQDPPEQVLVVVGLRAHRRPRDRLTPRGRRAAVSFQRIALLTTLGE